MPKLGEDHPVQYQRAEREYNEDEQQDLEEQRYKYVTAQQRTDNYFLMSSSTYHCILVRLQDKLGDNVVEPRSLEEEGIFVGKKPIVPTSVVRRAEKRILQECAKDNQVTTKMKIYILHVKRFD